LIFTITYYPLPLRVLFEKSPCGRLRQSLMGETAIDVQAASRRVDRAGSPITDFQRYDKSSDGHNIMALDGKEGQGK
jgi:hypothetical protein